MPTISLWPLGFLVLLLIGALAEGIVFFVLLLVWGAFAVWSLLQVASPVDATEATFSPQSVLSTWRPLLFYIILAVPALLAARPEWSAALLPLLAVVLLASLLNRTDTAASARSWARWVGWGLWALCGVLSMALLDSYRVPSIATVVLLVGLIGYNAARRAIIIQRRRALLAHSAGVIVGALGATLLAHSDEAPLYAFCVLMGVLLFYFTEALLPSVEPKAQTSRPAQIAYGAIIVQHQLACAAPIMVAILWIARNMP